MRRGVRHQVQRHGPVLGAPAPRGRLPHLPGEWPAGGTRACEPPSLSAGALPREERPHSSTPRLVPGLLVLVGRSCHYSASLRVSRPPGLCRMWSGVGIQVGASSRVTNAHKLSSGFQGTLSKAPLRGPGLVFWKLFLF